MNWNELKDKHFKWACKNGQHDTEHSNNHWIMLIITEISEAVQADRKNDHADVVSYKNISLNGYAQFSPKLFELYIKNTFEDELADIILRLLDFAGLLNLNIELNTCLDYNESHHKIINGYKSFTEFAYKITELVIIVNDIWKEGIISSGEDSIVYEHELYVHRIKAAINSILTFCKQNKIDIMWHIEQKMKYNETRPRLNGKLY